MDKNGIVFVGKDYIGGTCGTDITETLNRVVILVDGHQSGDAVVLGGVDHLIDDISFSKSVVRRGNLIVIHHYGNGTLKIRSRSGKTGELIDAAESLGICCGSKSECSGHYSRENY